VSENSAQVRRESWTARSPNGVTGARNKGLRVAKVCRALMPGTGACVCADATTNRGSLMVGSRTTGQLPESTLCGRSPTTALRKPILMHLPTQVAQSRL